MFWLGHLLDAAAFLALPAKSVLDATRLLMQLNVTVDVLVINLALPGGVEFTSSLQHSNRDIRVIGVLNDSVEMANIPRVNAILFKNSVLNEAAKMDWLQCIQAVLTQGRTAAALQIT